MIDKDVEIVKDFINNKVERDKLELNPKGGYKIGIIYKTTKLNPALENVLKEVEELQDDLRIHEETSFDFQKENIELRKELEKKNEEICEYKKAIECKKCDCSVCEAHINNLEIRKELKTQINNTHILQSQLDVANAEKIEWKKIAETLAEIMAYLPMYEDGTLYDTKEAVLDWARNEVDSNGKK